MSYEQPGAALRQAQDERNLLLGAAEELQIEPEILRQAQDDWDLDAQVRTLTVMALIILLTAAAMLVAIGAAIGMAVAEWGGVCA